MKKILEIVSASVGYNHTPVLKEVNLEVYENDFIGVIGPNGGGKTTLLRLLLGELKPFKGEVKYYTQHDNDTLFGYLPQVAGVDKRFPISAKDVVLSGIMGSKGLLGRYGAADRRRAKEMLERLGVEHLAGKAIGELSGGQMQRVFLGRALISHPRLLILDEPNTYVDNKFEKELYELLEDLNKEMAIIMVSHDVGTITTHVKTIACVNKTLHYHRSNRITNEQLASYDCPIQLIAHGTVPHTVLESH